MHRESKAELTDRLRREGRWEEFKKRREALKAAGNEAKDAWFIAATEFPPQSTDPATGSAAVIEPTIPWAKARFRLEAAQDDMEWLLLAMNVKVPARIAAQAPQRFAMLTELRGNPLLRTELHRLLLRQLATKKRFRAPYMPSLKEYLGWNR